MIKELTMMWKNKSLALFYSTAPSLQEREKEGEAAQQSLVVTQQSRMVTGQSCYVIQQSRAVIEQSSIVTQ